MSKCISIFKHKKYQFYSLAEKLLLTSKLEYLGTPPSRLKEDYDLIDKQLSTIKTLKDAVKLLDVVEQTLLHDVSGVFGSTSCVNCVAFVDCPKFGKIQENYEGPPPQPYPYDEDALNLCNGYHPNWDKYDEVAKIYPNILMRLELSFGIVVDRKRIAGKLLDVMGLWAATVGLRS